MSPEDIAENPDELEIDLEEVEITPSAPAAPAPAEVAATNDNEDDDPVTSEYLQKYGKKAEKRIRKLVADRRDAEERAAAAAKELETLRADLSRYKTQSTTSQTIAFNEAEARLKAEQANAQKAVADALTEGDPDKAALAYTNLAKTINEYENLKLYAKPAAPTAEQPQPAPTPTRQQQPAPSERGAAWARANPWFFSDKFMHSAALAIDAEVQKEGFVPAYDEESYFEELDRRLREKFPEKFVKKGATPLPSAGTSGPARRKVTLSRDEMALAERMLLGLPNVETKEKAYKLYAMNKREAV